MCPHWFTPHGELMEPAALTAAEAAVAGPLDLTQVCPWIVVWAPMAFRPCRRHRRRLPSLPARVLRVLLLMRGVWEVVLVVVIPHLVLVLSLQ